MATDFFRFPHTPHLAWLGVGAPRDDKVLSPTEAYALLAGDVVVEEKIDGTNLGFSLDAAGQLRAQNRGQYLTKPFAGQFARLSPWLALHGGAMASVIGSSNLVIFGEWCAVRHSLGYDLLPDWYLVFDVYDGDQRSFWSSRRRNALALRIGLKTVPEVAAGHLSFALLENLLATRLSVYGLGPMEGLVVRRESADVCEARAKLVRADFTQAMGEHWRKRTLEWNCLRSADTMP